MRKDQMSTTSNDIVKIKLDIDVEHDLEVDSDGILHVVSYIYPNEDEEPVEMRTSIEELLESIMEYYSEDLSREGFGQMYVVGHELRRIAEGIIASAQALEDIIMGNQACMFDDIDNPDGSYH
jgi:hypothetical protein